MTAARTIPAIDPELSALCGVAPAFGTPVGSGPEMEPVEAPAAPARGRVLLEWPLEEDAGTVEAPSDEEVESEEGADAAFATAIVEDVDADPLQEATDVCHEQVPY